MVSASKSKSSLFRKSTIRVVFFALYQAINIFISIGELTSNLIVSIVKFIRFIVVTPFTYIWQQRVNIKKASTIFFRTVFSFLGYVLRAILVFLNTIILLPFRFISSLFSPELKAFLLGILICVIGFSLFTSYRFVVELPSPTDIGKLNYPLSTHMYDRNGKLLYEIYKDQNRTSTKLTDLPKYVYQATIAIEDKDFYAHSGVSFFGGILRAAKTPYLKKVSKVDPLLHNN